MKPKIDTNKFREELRKRPGGYRKWAIAYVKDNRTQIWYSGSMVLYSDAVAEFKAFAERNGIAVGYIVP